ncbi:MAG: ABC transporter substrate-binding protein, partial [Candidatus Tectomicrobia bacterium]
TVRVRLNYPSPSFIKFLAVDYMKIVPKHVVEAGVDINRWQKIVGSGPFIIKRSRRGDSTTFERNPNYFKTGRPYLDRLTVMTVADAGTAAAAIKAGKIHMTTAVTAIGVEDALRLAKTMPDRIKVFFQPMNAGFHFFANVEREPWTDLRLIKALRLATDQWELQEAFGEGRYQIGAPFPVGSWYGSTVEELHILPGYRRPKDQDIEDARKLLHAAGYATPAQLGKRVMTAPKAAHAPDLAQLWAAQMRRNLGLEVEIKLVDTPTGVTAYVAGNFDLGVWGYGFNIADPDDWVNAIYGPGARNYTRWKNPEFLKLFDQQSRELDTAKRRTILRQMEHFLLTVEDPYIQVTWAPWYYVINNQVRTEAGPYIPAETIQVALKWDHVWLES